MAEIVRLLCVDDEAYILNVVRRQLADVNIEIHCALTAADGLRLLTQLKSVEVVISDYRMPGMDGIEFLQQVSAICPSAACILLSGFTDVAAVQQSVASNYLFCSLRKPWRAEELRRVIKEAIAAASKNKAKQGATSTDTGEQPDKTLLP